MPQQQTPEPQAAEAVVNISVQICTHNRKQVLRAVLESLVDQTLPPDRFELVLVDDGCTDGTREMVEGLDLPYPVTYLRQDHSGLATARNTGLRASRGRIILYIDDDVLADPRLLEEHVVSHARHDRCVVNGWVNHVEEPRRPERREFQMADVSTSFFWTSNVSVQRRHLFEAGMFDEDFKEYGWEDQEVGLRLMALGLKARNNYRAVGYHVKRPPLRQDLERILAQSEAKGRTAVLYINKHPRLRTRMSTGIHPPRLAVDRVARLGGWLETLCRKRLERPGLGPEDELRGLDAWCVRQLATLRYYDAIRATRT